MDESNGGFEGGIKSCCCLEGFPQGLLPDEAAAGDEVLGGSRGGGG